MAENRSRCSAKRRLVPIVASRSVPLLLGNAVSAMQIGTMSEINSCLLWLKMW